MKKLRMFLSMLLIIALSFTMAFAGNGNEGFKTGDLTEESTENHEKIAEKFIKSEFKGSEFKIKKNFKQEGLSTIRLQQYYYNVPVWKSEIIVNVSDKGVVKSVIGLPITLEGKLAHTVEEKINKPQATRIALEALGFKPVLLSNPKAELVVYNYNNVSRYAYFVEIVFDEPTPGRWFTFVDAETGAIINSYNKLATGKPSGDVTSGSDSTGTGSDVLGQQRSFGTTNLNGDYYLVDLNRNIYTMDARNRTRLPGSMWQDGDNIFNASYDAAAVSSQYNLTITYDYFMDKFGRDSFDNMGAQITSSVHVGRAYNNAYWNGSQFAFGDGDGSTFIALSGALDVVAHEFMHAVTEHTADLIYSNESGALNEAMSDIFGAAVEFHANENPDWLLGEDIVGSSFANPALRSMEDPTVCGDPDHYSVRYTGTQDYGGVHINSGIINKVAYLLAEGGSHYGVSVQGQGVVAMEEIFYRALTTYMTPSTNFAAAKLACEQAAADLYGANSAQVQSVTQAFIACGIN